MLIKYVPQVSSDKIKYIFSKDKIEACYKNKTDIFDFSGMPDGLVGDPQKDIKTDLELNPFCFVQRKNGVLSIKILNFIDEDATEEERFPDWVDSEDLVSEKGDEKDGEDTVEETDGD